MLSTGNVVYEQIDVTSTRCNKFHENTCAVPSTSSDSEENEIQDSCSKTFAQPKNASNVYESAMRLQEQTAKALEEGFYPIVLGGDHSQAIGSISGMKRVYPDAKIVWIDAHIDANTPESSPSGNAHGMPLTYLAGMVPGQEHWKCVDIASELCYFGIRSYEDDELQLIKDQQVLVFEAPFCQPEKLDDIEIIMKQYFKNAERNQKEKKLTQPVSGAHQKYWLSFDIDAVDASEFRSTGTAEDKGITRNFVKSFFDRMVSHSIGLDFSEVNFDLCEGEQLAEDEEAFREIFEVIVTSVNKPAKNVVFDDWQLVKTVSLLKAIDNVTEGISGEERPCMSTWISGQQ